MRCGVREVGAAAAAVLALALTACGSSGGAASSPTPTEPSAVELTGRLQQYREDEVAHVLQVELTNTGTSTVRVEQLRVDWPGLDGTDDANPAYDLRPGVTTALKVPYGEAVCDGDTRPTDPVNAVVTTPDSQAVVPLEVSDELLAKLWDEDCVRQRILQQVDVAFGPEWTPTTVDGAPVLRGSIVLTRGTSTTPVTLLDLDGSVLLTLDGSPPKKDPLGVLEPSQQTLAVPVDVGATMRCTGHVLGESKKTYVFDVGLDLGDGKRVDITLQPPDDVKPQMYAVIEKACGL